MIIDIFPLSRCCYVLWMAATLMGGSGSPVRRRKLMVRRAVVMRW